MKKVALLYLIHTAAFFFIFPLISCAQNPQVVDSLRKEINSHVAKDSLLVRMLLNYANAIVFENTDSAMKYADAALQLSQKLKWQRGIASGLNQKGLVYYYTSDYLNAIDYYQKALQAGESLHNKLFEANVYNNIANIYADLGQSDKALVFYNKLLAISQEMKNKSFETIALVNIGNIYTDKDNFIKGLGYFKNGLRTAQEINNLDAAAMCLSNIGALFKEMKAYDSARSYLEASIKLSEKTSSKNAEAAALTELALVYISFGNYSEAEKYSLQSLAVAKEINHVQYQANAYKALSRAYEKENKSGKALDAYKNYISLHDSIMNDKKKEDLTRLEMQYSFNKTQDSIKAITDKQQALATAQIQKQRILKNTALAGTGLLLLIGFGGFALYKRNRDIRFMKQISDTELKALRAQMNPHFIFNSLNSINDYIDKHDTETATMFTTKFAKLMRRILENSEQKEILLSNELQTLELYLQLEAMRLQNGFAYEIQVDEDIDKDNTLIPPLLLQPFLENSILHGITKKKEGKIMLHIRREGDMLSCAIEDNGTGIPPDAATKEQQQERKSLGTKITRERIDIINKLKNSNGKVALKHLAQGTRAEVTLPFETAY